MGKDLVDSLSINDTWLGRIVTLTAIKIFRRFRACHHGSVLFLPHRLCVKYGDSQDLIEAATMQYVRQNTSIPVPKVYCAFKRKNTTYIVMQKIDGNFVGNGWNSRTKESREHILRQLKDMVDQMRRIPCPSHEGVASVTGGSLYDGRLPRPVGNNLRFGPFKNVPEFHRFLRLGKDVSSDHFDEVKALAAMHEGLWPLRFTHGDLSSLNVLVRGEDVVGLIDWETAGWYPDYWEYTSAWNVNPQNHFWREEVDRFLEPRPTELAMERLRMKYFGDFGDPGDTPFWN